MALQFWTEVKPWRCTDVQLILLPFLMKCHGGFTDGFLLGGLCLHGFVMLKKKKDKKSHKEGGRWSLGLRSVSLHCGRKGGDEGLFCCHCYICDGQAALSNFNSHILPHKKLQTNFKECQVNLDLCANNISSISSMQWIQTVISWTDEPV